MVGSLKEVRVITFFSIVSIVFVFIISVMSLYYINTIHTITENIYNHPLKVSNAALNVQKGVFKIHRDMKDIVLSSNLNELEIFLEDVENEEKNVYKNLEIIRNNILGQEGLTLYKQTYNLFKLWKPIRTRVVLLMKKKDYKDAINLTKQEGAVHVESLEKSASVLANYAHHKADKFKRKAHNTFLNFQFIDTVLFIFTIVILIIFTVYVRKRMKQYIESLLHSQEKIKELNDRFELAIDGTNDGLWDWDLKENSVYLSSRWKEMLGYRDDELPNSFETWKSRVHPEDLQEALNQIALAHRDPQVEYNVIHRLKHKDGSWVWILDRGQTIFDKNDKPIRMIGFHTDITKQKELELQLLEKEQLLQEAQRISNMGSWKLDIVSGKLTWSDEVYHIFEINKEEHEASYEIFLSQIHPDDREKVQNTYKTSLMTKKPYEIVHRLLFQDGRIKYVKEKCETTFDGHGKPFLSIGTVQDITQQKTLEDKLLNLKQQFEQFMEFIPANIMIKEDEEILYANSSAKEFLKLNKLKGKTFQELFSQEIFSKIQLLEENVYKNGFAEEVLEFTNEKKVFRNMSFLIEMKEKRKLGVVLIDITKEYRANREIARVLSAFERSNISVVMTDLSGNIEYVNPSWCRLTGYSKEELLGQNPRIVKSNSVSKQTYEKMWSELTNGKVWNSELKNRAKDGTEFWEDSTIIPSFDVKGCIDGYIAFKLEISDKIHLRKELKEQEEIMIAQSRHAAMGEMISMIAHQWRQPISVIAMDANNVLVDVELDEIDAENLQNDLGDIIDQTKYLSKTIDDFRNFFKPTKMKDIVLVSDVFEESFLVISKSLEHNNIEIINDFHTTTEVEIYSRELLQVFINILKNAKEALVENKESDRVVSNKIYEENGSIVISICDNAGGIDDSIIEDIFDPYFTTKNEMNGTGLGLYMSKTIIEKHFNGKISVFNSEKGACFEIRFAMINEALKGT